MVIIGASGHGRVVLSTAMAQKEKVEGFLDDNPALSGKLVLAHPIIGPISKLSEKCFSHAVFGLGMNALRKTLALQHHNVTTWQTLIHPNAYVHESARIGEGTVILAGAVIQPNAVIGKHCIVNTGATVDHDAILGDYVHLAPGVHLSAAVRVGEGVLVSIGSVVCYDVEIDDWSVIAPGQVVTKETLHHPIHTCATKERAC